MPRTRRTGRARGGEASTSLPRRRRRRRAAAAWPPRPHSASPWLPPTTPTEKGPRCATAARTAVPPPRPAPRKGLCSPRCTSTTCRPGCSSARGCAPLRAAAGRAPACRCYRCTPPPAPPPAPAPARAAGSGDEGRGGRRRRLGRAPPRSRACGCCRCSRCSPAAARATLWACSPCCSTARCEARRPTGRTPSPPAPRRRAPRTHRRRDAPRSRSGSLPP
mmetsp:Transcript_9950/g.29147  ORF Transcript_9950/g.29147 Transcript_9950/m.29147 type:complete len:220 (-) Transcript_9950:128-787(-)